MLLKGILHPDNAREALAQGADGISVSNHGGRQLDSALSAIAALPAIADAVGGRAGVVCALEILKREIDRALALGGWDSIAKLGRADVRALYQRHAALCRHIKRDQRGIELQSFLAIPKIMP
jgi:isopentenyl diphosphate isomerase/L-lactate dehydrogenase-like FMN-dependent dehydrogenase